MTPLYLATISELKESNINSWNYLNDNFSIFKLLFTTIGVFNAMEQENKLMKVKDVFVGITQNRFFLVAPVVSFCGRILCNLSQRVDITGSTNTSACNVNKLFDVMDNCQVNFESSDFVYYVSTAVLSQDSEDEILFHDSIKISFQDEFSKNLDCGSETL